MNTFNKIYSEINDILKTGSYTNGYLGGRDWKDFDEEDRKELETWEASGNSLRVKMIGGKEFSFDINYGSEDEVI